MIKLKFNETTAKCSFLKSIYKQKKAEITKLRNMVVFYNNKLEGEKTSSKE